MSRIVIKEGKDTLIKTKKDAIIENAVFVGDEHTYVIIKRDLLNQEVNDKLNDLIKAIGKESD